MSPELFNTAVRAVLLGVHRNEHDEAEMVKQCLIPGLGQEGDNSLDTCFGSGCLDFYLNSVHLGILA